MGGIKNRNIVLAACCLINLCLGSIYTWSVFAQAMASWLNDTVGLSVIAADLAIVYTVANSVGPVTMIMGGKINDSLGPRTVIMAGGIMFGGGFFLSGFAKSVGFLVVTFGIIGGLGLGMAYGSTISTAVKFFPDRRGFAGGITTAAYGLSSVILPPVVSYVTGKTNASFTFKLTGILFAAVICAAALFVQKYPGDKAAQNPAGQNPGIPSDRDADWKEMIRTPVFYGMLVLLICGAFSGMMILSQASSVAENMMGMSAANAAMIVSVIALFNMFGRLAAGFLSDRIGRLATLGISCVFSAAAQIMLFLSAGGNIFLFIAGIMTVGLCFGAFMGVYPGFTADRFGAAHNSVNYGIMCIGFALAGFFGPQTMRILYQRFSSYRCAFAVACIFAVIGLVLVWLIRISDRNKH